MIADSGLSFGYWELVLKLDELFEAYVGESWKQALDRDYIWTWGETFRFTVGTIDNGSSSQYIVPDHIFRHRYDNVVLVVDAKYRTDIGSSEQIYQMVSYLDYKYPDQEHLTRKLGALVYPGSEWRLYQVTGFGHNVFCIEMPVGVLNPMDITNLESKMREW